MDDLPVVHGRAHERRENLRSVAGGRPAHTGRLEEEDIGCLERETENRQAHGNHRRHRHDPRPRSPSVTGRKARTSDPPEGPGSPNERNRGPVRRLRKALVRERQTGLRVFRERYQARSHYFGEGRNRDTCRRTNRVALH